MPTDRAHKSVNKTPASAKRNGSKPSASNGSRSRKRIKKLFSDIENLTLLSSADCDGKNGNHGNDSHVDVAVVMPPPPSEDTKVQCELETLRARIQELESQLRQNHNSASAPLLYEKEQVGYAYKSDAVEPLKFSVHEQEFEAKNAIQVPLTATGRVIGSMYVEPVPERDWQPEEENLVNTVAQQTSLQIQSLRLLASAERARTEAEEATRRYMHESWASYLDAIHQNERIGYAYDQASIAPFLDDPDSEDSLRETVKVMDEQVGILSLKPDSTRPLTENDRKLVSAVADQVAQQVENIRLLADASRARAEAEEATRRMTRESWQSYTAHRREDTLGFAYDTVQVTPFGNSSEPENIALTVPLKVRGEPIGRLAIAGPERFSPEAVELAGTIAAQASTHLENLRLSEGMQESLNWQQAINRASVLIGQAKSIEDILRGAAELLPLLGMLSCSLSIIKEVDPKGIPTLCDIYTVRFVKDEFIGIPPVLGQPTAGWLPDDPRYYRENRVTIFPDLEDLTTIVPSDAYRAEGAVAYMLKAGMRSAIALALSVHNRAIGYLVFTNRTPLAFLPEDYIAWMASVVDLISAAIDNQLLFGETERGRQALARRAAELETVAKVSTTTSTVLDPEKLLQSVVDLTKERFGLYHAHIYLSHPDGATLTLTAGAGDVGRRMIAEGWNIPVDHQKSLVADAFRNRRSVVANNVHHNKNSAFLSNRLLPNTRSELAAPLIVGNKVLGVFDVQSEEANYFKAEDVNIYTTLAAQVAVALQNARLYVEQAATVSQLQELDRLKSGFLANMSHELRTPLNSILGFADVMLMELDGPLTPHMDNDLKLIQKNGQHLLHLINDVLDMAKIESGRMNLNPEKFRLHDLLEDVNSITSTLASERNLALFIEPDSDQEVEIYADNTRLRQVMINLVNNAIKFTETGKITIHAAKQDSTTVLIAVKDTGIGIPTEKLEDVFQEFTQVDTSTTRKVGGTGLGLPISRRLIEMHGGRLWAESTGISGEGSTFFVELPIEARITEVVEKREK